MQDCGQANERIEEEGRHVCLDDLLHSEAGSDLNSDKVFKVKLPDQD